jgi:hypothetical protein
VDGTKYREKRLPPSLKKINTPINNRMHPVLPVLYEVCPPLYHVVLNLQILLVGATGFEVLAVVEEVEYIGSVVCPGHVMFSYVGRHGHPATVIGKHVAIGQVCQLPQYLKIFRQYVMYLNIDISKIIYTYVE